MPTLTRYFFVAAALCCAASAFAVENPPAATGLGQLSATATTPGLAEGANSFTLEQARTRMTAAGFSGVADLSKDGRGVWHATASKDGKAVNLAMDYRGAVVQLP